MSLKNKNIEFHSLETSHTTHSSLNTTRISTVPRFSALNDFVLHLALLLKKNWIIQKRSKLLSMLLIFSPFFVCLFLSWMQSVTSGIAGQIEANPQITDLVKIPPCSPGPGPGPDATNDCVTILYSVIVSIFSLGSQSFSLLGEV